MTDNFDDFDDIFDGTCPKGARLDRVFTAFSTNRNNPVYWKAVGAAYTRVEWIDIEAPHWIFLFNQGKLLGKTQHIMDDDDIKLYDNLPDTFDVYRGVGKKEYINSRSLSWTTDSQIAQWFADRYKTFQGPGVVLKGTAAKSDVLATFDRGESEIVIDSDNII